MNTLKPIKLLNATNLAILALVLGLGIGAFAYNVYTSPKIQQLNSDLNQKTSQVSSLESQLQALNANYTEALNDLVQVTQQYNDLLSSSVSRSEYEGLFNIYHAQASELASIKVNYEHLTSANNELTTKYQLIEAKYNELRMLSWTSFTVRDLRVNLTVTTNQYSSNLSPITGTIRINYLDGRPFYGGYQLLVWSDYYRSGKESQVLTVAETASYTLESAFTLGPGNYYILVQKITDLTGNEIVPYNEISSYRIALKMG